MLNRLDLVIERNIASLKRHAAKVGLRVQQLTEEMHTDGCQPDESQLGLRVQQHTEEMHTDGCQPDYEKETPILSASTPPCEITNDFDLLDLGESSAPVASEPLVVPCQPVVDPFSNLIEDNRPTPSATPFATASEDLLSNAHQMNDNLVDLLDIGPSSPIHRNVSAPAFQESSKNLDPLAEFLSAGNETDLLNISASSSFHRNDSAPAFQENTKNLDPFAEFLSQSESNPVSAQASARNSGSTTPIPSRPNYSRTAFDNLKSSTTTSKAKKTGDVFEDLLSSHGFTASKIVNRTLGDMRRAEEIKDMDPVSVKVRDWAEGKQRNIRALLGSLNDVLWEGAEKWQQPRMGDLLSAAQVKRSYFKACLVVHPDKQVGEPHEQLARAIFTVLNEAWNAFEQNGSE
uniref:J domain-containing protein n=1 Tax=Haemonchus contortus TaxID=6289 RepID=A0A7I4YF59_HAECO|nr:Heat shock protein DnaJ domain containing protein [Haemonchus contortus]